MQHWSLLKQNLTSIKWDGCEWNMPVINGQITVNSMTMVHKKFPISTQINTTFQDMLSAATCDYATREKKFALVGSSWGKFRDSEVDHVPCQSQQQNTLSEYVVRPASVSPQKHRVICYHKWLWRTCSLSPLSLMKAFVKSLLADLLYPVAGGQWDTVKSYGKCSLEKWNDMTVI